MASQSNIVDYLIEWDFAVYDFEAATTTVTTYYFSMYDYVVTGGHTYEPRAEEIGNLESVYLDNRIGENFSDASFTFDNTPARGSTVRPFHALNEIDDFEDKRIRVYTWDGSEKTFLWWGLTKRPKFGNLLEDTTCTIDATFPWNALDIQIPRVSLTHRCPWAFKGSKTETTNLVPSAGCRHWNGVTGNPDACNKNYDDDSGVGGCTQHGNVQDYGGFVKIAPVRKKETNNLIDREKVRSACIPLVYGLDEFKVRPENTQARIMDDELVITGLISGTAIGFPFSGDEIDADRVRIFDHQAATDVIFLVGEDNPQPPINLDRFPDGAGHPNLAMISARFDLTVDQIDALEQDGVKFHATTVRMASGRVLARSGIPDDNPIYILEDILRDRIYGIALNPNDIDEDVLDDSAAYVGERFQFRLELDTQQDLKEFLKEYFGAIAGFITFENGKIQFGCKRDDETDPVAIFGTGGRLIDEMNVIDPEEKDFSELLNNLTFKMRDKFRHPLDLLLYDKQAQIKAGNSVEKEVSDNIFIPGVHEPVQGLIAAAIMLREQLNQDYFIEFDTPLTEILDVACGNIIRVNSEDILNNDSNYLFRVIGKSYTLNDEPSCRVRAQVYKPQVYAYNYDPIGGDILRGPTDTTTYMRPPDVLLDNEPTLAIVDKVKDTDPDTLEIQTVLDVLKAKWNYPDLTDYDALNEEEGIHTDKYPITAVDLWWKYTNESEHTLRRGARINYPATEGLIQVDHDPEKSVHVSFVSVASNYGTGRIGYVVDPTKTTAITVDVENDTTVFRVDDPSIFTIGDLVKIRSELLEIINVDGPNIEFDLDGAVRKTKFDTTARAYDAGTEIGVAVWSHPYETLALGGGRYNYPTVTSVIARLRRRGVRASWADVNRENVEAYIVIWGTKAALDTVATPGVWNPVWYTGNKPWESLPAGISYKKVKELHYVIPYEQIGDGENPSEVAVRVFAKYKRRYSTNISAPAVQFHGNGPLYEPRAPAFGADFIISNDAVPGTNHVEIIYRVRFDKDLSTRTAGEAEVTHGGIKFQRFDKKTDAWLPAVMHWEGIEDFDQTYVDIKIRAHVGAKIRINRCLTRNDGRVVRKSTVTDITFRAGAETDDILGITSFVIGTLRPVDNKHTEIPVSWHNAQVEGSDTLNVALRRIELWEHIVGQTNPALPGYWHVELADKIRDDPSFEGTGTPGGSYNFGLTWTAKHKVNTNYGYKYRLYAVGSNAYIETPEVTLLSDPSDATGDTAITGTQSSPTTAHVTRNHIVGDPAEGTVEVAVTPYAQFDGSIDFGTNGIRHVTVVLQDFTTGEYYRKSVKPDPTAFFVPVTFRLKADRRYRWERTIYENNAASGGRVDNSNFIAIIAGSHIFDEGTPGTIVNTGSHSFDANDATQSTTFSISVGTPILIHPRQSRVPVTITQRTVRPVLLKKLILETNVPSIDSTTYRRATPETILDEAGYYSAASVTRVIQFTVEHPKGVGVGFNSRVTAIPYGSNIGSASLNKTATNTGAGGSEPDPPVVPPNPGTAATAPTFKASWVGGDGLHASFTKPTDQRPYYQYHEFQFSDNSANTTATRDWLNYEDGSLAYAAAVPTANGAVSSPLANASATVEGNRYHNPNIKKRDLDNTFKTGSVNGTLTLFVRCRICDLDDSGNERYSNWSVWSSVTFQNRRDKNPDDPLRNRMVGRANLLEGFSCATNGLYPQPATGATVDTLGKEFRYGFGGSAQLIAVRTSLGESGNPYDVANRNIYWDKATRSIIIYGNSATAGKQVCTQLYGNVTNGQKLWLTFALRATSAFTLGTWVIAIYDKVLGTSIASISIVSMALTTSFQLFAVPLTLSSAPSNDTVLVFAFPNWASPAPSSPIYLTHGCLSQGNEPRLFEAGRQEAGMVFATGVSKADFGGLAALEAAGGGLNEGVTSWGIISMA